MTSLDRARSPIRLGFVGGAASFIGRVHRAAALLSGRFAIVAGCFSSNRQRSLEFGLDQGIAPERIYQNFEQMAAGEASRADGIEAVVILTPNASHPAVARVFVEQGRDVICEKPVATRLDEAVGLQRLVQGSDRVFAVAHAYTGYATVQEIRARVRSGSLGKVRIVQAEYAQGWMSSGLESSGNKIAALRTDPDINGPAGCVSAVGSHLFNLADFVTGLEIAEIAADLTAFVPGRRTPDNAHVMVRYVQGARGMMWISQVAVGHHNGLRLRIYGEDGSLFWDQEDPEHLVVNVPGMAERRLVRGHAEFSAPQDDLPPGHPQGFIGAFTAFYRACGEQIDARNEQRAPAEWSRWIPTLSDGVRTVKFAESALRSSGQGGSWVPFG